MATDCTTDQRTSPKYSQSSDECTSSSDEELEVFFGPVTAKERAIAAALLEQENAVADEQTVNNNDYKSPPFQGDDATKDADVKYEIMKNDFQTFPSLEKSPSVDESPDLSSYQSEAQVKDGTPRTIDSSLGSLILTLDLSSSFSSIDEHAP
ncbi:uncharacterized protein LOC117125146 [Anneissia japonica]|uniref:uncharacterized protein LOC117125146 n=1 Tax=Anneissia japonica TaxID=1529436 RepID=UPI00142589C4|nr:uncharacterized protein LOC117125146 [Anneissia japonica]